jgi:Transmembrane domain of unknown function (DUF3566)
VTRPENAEQTKEPEVRGDDIPPRDSAPTTANGPAKSAPRQRQRPGASTMASDGDSKPVTLQVGAPEHARGAVRDQPDRPSAPGRAYGFSAGVGPPIADTATKRQPLDSLGANGPSDGGADFSPPTVRVGGYTAPERVAPASPAAPSRSVRVPRQTSLQLRRLDPWSVLKISLVLSVCGFLVWLVAVGLLYGVLASMGVWDQINGTYSDLTSVNNPQVNELVSGGRVFGAAFVIGLVNIVLMTALATVGSLVYNVVADFVGGIEVTLSEPD